MIKYSPINLKLRMGAACAIGALLFSFAGCNRSATSSSVSEASLRLHGLEPSEAKVAEDKIIIDYPKPGEADPLNLRNCALSGDYGELPCRLIGARGPIKKISWRDDNLNVVEAAIEFDRAGQLQRVCRRGHTDFQGWGCGTPPFSKVEDQQQTLVDARGRTLRRLHFQFAAGKFDTCVYNDSVIPNISECRVEDEVVTFKSDPTGRVISYSVRLTPHTNDSPERQAELARAYSLNLDFVYKNDSHSNWISFQAIGVNPDSGLREVMGHEVVDVEYY